jgi:hypothetical protein
MAPTAFSFTDNVSAAVAFSGIVKIKCDDMIAGDYVIIQEERNDGAYENSADQNIGGIAWGLISGPQRSGLFELYGNYKVVRSRTGIAVGYVAG